MKKLIVGLMIGLSLNVFADWTMVVNKESNPNNIIVFGDYPIGAVGTKFTLTTYTNYTDAIVAMKTAVSSGATYDTNSIVIPEDLSQQYIYEDTFLLICDQLSSSTNHIKLPMESLSMILLQLKAVDKTKYENVRDGLSMLNASLTRENVRWWDTVVWHDDPTVVSGALQLFNLMQ